MTTIKDDVHEQHLASMIHVLRRFLGKATSGDWRKHMETYGKWSKSSFDRRLRIVKARGWVRIVGDTEVVVDRVPEGSLFEVTENAPRGAPESVSNQCQNVPVAPEDMNSAADAAAKAAMELLQRLNKSKPPNAA